MPYISRFQLGAAQRLPGELEDLGRRLSELPEPHAKSLKPLYERVVEGFRLRSRIMNVAKEALERIRLEVACLQFDLDVTRREKDQLERKLDGGD